jgi:hypothetical protein
LVKKSLTEIKNKFRGVWGLSLGMKGSGIGFHIDGENGEAELIRERDWGSGTIREC